MIRFFPTIWCINDEQMWRHKCGDFKVLFSCHIASICCSSETKNSYTLYCTSIRTCYCNTPTSRINASTNATSTNHFPLLIVQFVASIRQPAPAPSTSPASDGLSWSHALFDEAYHMGSRSSIRGTSNKKGSGPKKTFVVQKERCV